MLIKQRRAWEIPEREATPESVYLQRRQLLKGMGAGAALLAGGAAPLRAAFAAGDDPTADLYPLDRNPAYTLDDRFSGPTPEELATTYNNFYEFGSHKQISAAAQVLKIRPWTVTIDGLVEEEKTVDADDLIRQMPLEERLYRHRCVEAWSMAVPWSGFPLKALVDFARPTSGAKYIRMETFNDPDMASGQRQFWYPWPYIEGLTIEEATNELAFIATGLYGKPMPKQNGAPLRLAVPWKYGFKSIKSIVRFSFTEERPKSFWEEIQSSEYGFWANVNPEVSHPRWSQASERPLGGDTKIPTLLYNGYEEFVADLYKDLQDQPLFM
ncbi:MAG: protein-methionine-sulfoxide reductase catalytic subunit MsrP [Alphaproteobacteria bacterium]